MTDYTEFHKTLLKAKHILILTGAGISAESGIPTFRGSEGLWRKYDAMQLATLEAFEQNPSLLWEFYHYARELVFRSEPNQAHISIAVCEKALEKENRQLTIVTQNVDGLHKRAGSNNVIELHGSLFKTKCLSCNEVAVNTDSPICSALEGKGAPDVETSEKIPLKDLPRCKKINCKGLLRPHVVWFGEMLDSQIIKKTEQAMSTCDACLIIGTSSIVYPAALFAPALAERGIPVAEFNLESTQATSSFKFHFQGRCTETIPKALNLDFILRHLTKN